MRQDTKENMCKTRTSNENTTMRKSLGQKMILFLIMFILLVQIKGKYYRSKKLVYFDIFGELQLQA